MFEGFAFYEPPGSVLVTSVGCGVVIYERVRRREPFRKVLAEIFPYKRCRSSAINEGTGIRSLTLLVAYVDCYLLELFIHTLHIIVDVHHPLNDAVCGPQILGNRHPMFLLRQALKPPQCVLGIRISPEFF